MRIEVGVDIVEISRFDDLLSDDNFINRYFTDEEREYCFSQNAPAQHFAARFAGKEAVVKAMYGFGVRCRLWDVEILNNDDGVPRVYMCNYELDFEEYEIKMSLSHAGGMAIAYVVVYVVI